MGCDIHMHVEYKSKRYDEWCCGDYFALRSSSSVDSLLYYCVPIYDARNYSLFATLANVRNYGNTDYIDEPRGLPDDVNFLVKEAYDDWFGDAHSCSYFTLRELIDFHNEKHPLKRSGMINSEQAEQLDKYGILPDSWCQYATVPSFVWREWEEENYILEPLIEKLKERADELGLIYKFYWDGNSYDKAYELSDGIRIVFWFDN